MKVDDRGAFHPWLSPRYTGPGDVGGWELMGNRGSHSTDHFTWHKRKLEWLGGNQISRVATPGHQGRPDAHAGGNRGRDEGDRGASWPDACDTRVLVYSVGSAVNSASGPVQGQASRPSSMAVGCSIGNGGMSTNHVEHQPNRRPGRREPKGILMKHRTSLIASVSLLAGTAIVLPGASAHAAPTRYQAESSPAICTGTIDSNHTGYSGTGFCNGNNAVGAYAQFSVNASAAGTATLGVRFANGTTDSRFADLIVNGTTVRSAVALEGTGAWNAWATRTLSVPVNAGGNTIQLNPTTSSGLPNIDYLDFEVGSASGPDVTWLSDTQLDASALYFVSYDGIVNNASYQQDGIVTYAGYQYTAWYTATRHAMVARRQLPSGAWQVVQLPHQLSIDDSHNSISLGFSRTDGRLHIGMDTHNNAIYYVKSEAGLVSNPGGVSWSASRFGGVQRSLDGVSLGSITYPRFITTPEGRLQLSYRTGGSGNGTMELAEYNGGTWARLGRWSSASGNYTRNGATSTTRNLYLHGISYGPGGRLHASFTWREGNGAVLCHRGGLSNHDTGYVYSDDRGRTWRNNSGQLLANTGSSNLVSVSSPGHVVDPLTVDHALINQESQAIDSAGNPHVIISYVPGRFTQCVSDFTQQRIEHGRAFHVWRDSAGTWRKMEIPEALNAFGRSQIVLDSADNAYVVMPYGRIVTASAASGWTDWTVRFDGSGLNAFGEVVVDRSRVPSGVLSILYQHRSSGRTPSPIRVVDFRLGGPVR